MSAINASRPACAPANQTSGSSEPVTTRANQTVASSPSSPTTSNTGAATLLPTPSASTVPTVGNTYSGGYTALVSCTTLVSVLLWDCGL